MPNKKRRTTSTTARTPFAAEDHKLSDALDSEDVESENNPAIKM